MRIAIASDDGVNIAGHFGRTRGFLIYEVEEGKVKDRNYRVNDFTGHARGMEGADHSLDRHAPIISALDGCQAVISRGMGRRIYDDLQRVGIEAFIVQETDADSALNLYINNNLLDNPEQGCEH